MPGITQNQLVERVRIDQSTMAHTLKRMERDGLVERRPDATDRRRTLIMLTDHARKIQSDLVAAAQEVNSSAINGLTDEEITACMITLARMIDNLESGPQSGVSAAVPP